MRSNFFQIIQNDKRLRCGWIDKKFHEFFHRKQTNLFSDSCIKLLNLKAHVRVGGLKKKICLKSLKRGKKIFVNLLRMSNKKRSAFHRKEGITCQGNMRNWSKLILLHNSKKEVGKRKK
jgi:hypothetical protein